MGKKILSALCLFLITAGQAWAEPGMEFEGRYWMPGLTSSVKSTAAGVGTNIDLRKDLGVKDEIFPDLRLIAEGESSGMFRVAFNQFNLSGNRFIGQDIEFGGKTFTTSTRVKTDLDINYARLGWAWKSNLMDTVKIGPLVEIKTIWANASLKAPEALPSPVKESQKFAFGVPTLGLVMEINPLEMVSLFAEASGLPLGNLGYFLDSEGGIKIVPIKYLSIVGGYRIFDIKIEKDSDFARLKMHGPFAGATLRF